MNLTVFLLHAATLNMVCLFCYWNELTFKAHVPYLSKCQSFFNNFWVVPAVLIAHAVALLLSWHESLWSGLPRHLVWVSHNTIGELPKLCVKIRPDSWLVCCLFRCHREWRHEWQHGGLCPCRRSFGCVLLLDQIFRNQCTVRQYTTLIYLINLLGKLVLGLRLDSELHYFSIFTENKKNEHLIFCECHGR